MESIWETGSDGGVLHHHLDWLVAGLEWVAAIIDLFAIALLLLGAARFIAGVAKAEIRGDDGERVRATNAERIELGRYILAGLELFIVSDIIHTALSLALADLVFLGLLVIIRSLISFFLDRELEQVKQELRDWPDDEARRPRRDRKPPPSART
ncbi:DUF1622 domain-containing protein [Limimaricola pyoseonensis]|uniref:Uncharacterized membrane protein n=1 Tax=Limimaricola pyoseonensis TaxID=521013 RepID=A0A1G6ZDM8_9RHOB|nr:DUF1622 domain-containing protein [Limimaricola pyoseonensis]SDE00592.1 Uncharacterized membrane protein [Limimaricola pyoseonensis]